MCCNHFARETRSKKNALAKKKANPHNSNKTFCFTRTQKCQFHKSVLVLKNVQPIHKALLGSTFADLPQYKLYCQGVYETEWGSRDLVQLKASLKHQQHQLRPYHHDIDGVMFHRLQQVLTDLPEIDQKILYVRNVIRTIIEDTEHKLIVESRLKDHMRKLFPLSHVNTNVLAHLRYNSDVFSLAFAPDSQFYAMIKPDAPKEDIPLEFFCVDPAKTQLLNLPSDVKISLIHSSDQLEQWMSQFILADQAKHIGIDCEWMSDNFFTPDLIQMATGKSVALVLNASKIRNWPASFLDMMSNPNILKLWASGSQDITRLRYLLSVEINGNLEMDPKSYGIAKLLAIRTNTTIEKNKSIARFTKWNSSTLTDAQIRYASLDAYANWYYFMNAPSAARTSMVLH